MLLNNRLDSKGTVSLAWTEVSWTSFLVFVCGHGNMLLNSCFPMLPIHTNHYVSIAQLRLESPRLEALSGSEQATPKLHQMELCCSSPLSHSQHTD